MQAKLTTTVLFSLLLVFVCLAVPDRAFCQSDGPVVGGTLRDGGQPIADAALILQQLDDEDCAKLFESRNPGPDAGRKLARCSRDLPEQKSDEQGRFTFKGLNPGWYALRFLWNIQTKPAQPLTATTQDQRFVVFYAGRKDSTGRFDTMAQGRPFHFAGKEDVVIDFDYRPSPETQKPPETTARGRISLPNKNWGLVLELPGFKVESIETKPDGRRYFFATNKASGVIVSVFLEEFDPSKKGRSCRDNLAERVKSSAPYSRKDSKLYEKGEMAVLEFLIPEYQGVKIRQKNLFTCQIHDNVYIDFHFSKTDYQSGDDQKFWQILDTMQFQGGIQRTSLDYMQVASVHYLQRNYAKAIPVYERALELEKQKRELDKRFWYVLIDNLGMAYAFTGNLAKSKETFEYGVSQDPSYPLFYYNLACTYAEMNDLENAKVYLKKAFEYKQNVIPGEGMPDPRQDDSFKRFLKDEEFRKFLDSLMVK